MIYILLTFFISFIFIISDVNKKYKWYENIEITLRALLFPFYYCLLMWTTFANVLLLHYMVSLDLDLSTLAWKTMGLFPLIITMGIIVIGFFSYIQYKKRVEEIQNVRKK